MVQLDRMLVILLLREVVLFYLHYKMYLKI